MIRGLALVLAFYGVGALLERVAHLPVPGAVVGLVAFVIALRSGIVKRASVEEACGFLTGRMALFLVPASVLVVGSASLGGAIVPIVVASVGSALAVMIVVGLVAQKLAPPSNDEGV